MGECPALLVQQKPEAIVVQWQGQTLVEYHYPSAGARPYCQPLRLPDSPPLTAEAPADHPHHQGMWLAWKKVNKVNFWEQPAAGGDPSGFGRIVHHGVVACQREARAVYFQCCNGWIDWRGTEHLQELRSIRVHQPREERWLMDVGFRLTAGQGGAELDLCRGAPGQVGCFYSGLTIRFDKALSPGRLLDAEGRSTAEAIYGGRSRWCSYCGTHADDGRTYGITMVDHPRNPRHPTPWWVRNMKGYAVFGPSPCYDQPLRIAAGESIEFQYRIIIHKGSLNREQIDLLAADGAWSS